MTAQSYPVPLVMVQLSQMCLLVSFSFSVFVWKFICFYFTNYVVAIFVHPVGYIKARHEPWPGRKRFSSDHVWRGRSKPGYRIVGLHTRCWLSTEVDNRLLPTAQWCRQKMCLPIWGDEMQLIKVKVKVNICYSAPSRQSHRKGAQVHGTHQTVSHIPALLIVVGNLPHLFNAAMHWTDKND